MFTIIITFLSAISISVIAAGYSIIGLSTLFAGAVIPIIAMGSALEVGKLVAASWLYNNWRNKLVPKTIKAYLTFAVIVLIFITSMGKRVVLDFTTSMTSLGLNWFTLLPDRS